jgi:hypothetical protein
MADSQCLQRANACLHVGARTGDRGDAEVLNPVTRDNGIGFSMNFLQKPCMTLLASFGTMHNRARNEYELNT